MVAMVWLLFILLSSTLPPLALYSSLPIFEFLKRTSNDIMQTRPKHYIITIFEQWEIDFSSWSVCRYSFSDLFADEIRWVLRQMNVYARAHYRNYSETGEKLIQTLPLKKAWDFSFLISNLPTFSLPFQLTQWSLHSYWFSCGWIRCHFFLVLRFSEANFLQLQHV